MIKNCPKTQQITKRTVPDVKRPSVLARLGLAGDLEEGKLGLLTEEDKKLEPSRSMKAHHVPWIDGSKGKDIPLPADMDTEVMRHSLAKKTSKEPDQSTLSLYFRENSQDAAGSLIYCECGNVCESNKTLCSACSKANESKEYSGFLYLKKRSGDLKRYWYTLVNKELYCIFI